MSVFQISELASLVCQFSDLKACTQLLYTCRGAFYAAIPYVWHTVDGVDKLFALIPGVSFKSKKNTPFCIRFPDNVTSQLSRYELYAQHVKQLDVYGERQRHFHLHDWHIIASRSSFQFRLPKLEVLTIQTSDRRATLDQLFWISAFVTSSTHTIAILAGEPRPRIPSIPVETGSIIAETILHRATNIRRLELYPTRDYENYNPTDKEGCLLSYLYKQPYMEILGRFQHLVELSTSSVIISRTGFQVLGNMFHLQVLSLYPSYEDYKNFEYELDDTSLPALRKLSLHLQTEEELIKIFETTPIIRHLTTLSIYFSVFEVPLHEDEGEDETLWVAAYLLTPLEQALDLEDLTIHFDVFGVSELPLEILEFSHIANSLTMLPIKKLTLFSANIALENFTEEGFDALMWPQLTHLRIPDQEAPAEVLLSLSGFSMLQHLEVQFDFTEIELRMAAGSSVNHSLQTIEGSKGSTIDADPDKFEQHVGFLRSLWPNLQHIAWPEGFSATEIMYVNRLNKRLNPTGQFRSTGETDVSSLE